MQIIRNRRSAKSGIAEGLDKFVEWLNEKLCINFCYVAERKALNKKSEEIQHDALPLGLSLPAVLNLQHPQGHCSLSAGRAKRSLMDFLPIFFILRFGSYRSYNLISNNSQHHTNNCKFHSVYEPDCELSTAGSSNPSGSVSRWIPAKFLFITHIGIRDNPVPITCLKSDV